MTRTLMLVVSFVSVCLSVATNAAAQNGPYYATPSWDQTLPCTTTANCPRFVLVMGGDAVLDRETGLVWEKTPVTDTEVGTTAMAFCRTHLVGGRRGWRLPSFEELTSLLDPTQSAPALPAGHPFVGIGAFDFFWTSTQAEGTPGDAYQVLISNGIATTIASETASIRYWCVRGGSAVTNPIGHQRGCHCNAADLRTGVGILRVLSMPDPLSVTMSGLTATTPQW